MSQTINITKRNGSKISFETAHTFETAMQTLDGMKSNDFAQSLFESFGRYGNLSEKQQAWAFKLAEDNTPTIEQDTLPERIQTAMFDALIAWFQATGLKTPRITLNINGLTLKVAMAGSRSRYCGDLMVTDGKAYGNNQYWGRIQADGANRLTSNCPDWVTARLVAWNDNPASILDEARAHGHKTGNCCFCSKFLTTRESVTVGYGPICAGKYGLPWGEIVDREPVEIVSSVSAPLGGFSTLSDAIDKITPERAAEMAVEDDAINAQARADRADRETRNVTPLTELAEFF